MAKRSPQVQEMIQSGQVQDVIQVIWPKTGPSKAYSLCNHLEKCPQGECPLQILYVRLYQMGKKRSQSVGVLTGQQMAQQDRQMKQYARKVLLGLQQKAYTQSVQQQAQGQQLMLLIEEVHGQGSQVQPKSHDNELGKVFPVYFPQGCKNDVNDQGLDDQSDGQINENSVLGGQPDQVVVSQEAGSIGILAEAQIPGGDAVPEGGPSPIIFKLRLEEPYDQNGHVWAYNIPVIGVNQRQLIIQVLGGELVITNLPDPDFPQQMYIFCDQIAGYSNQTGAPTNIIAVFRIRQLIPCVINGLITYTIIYSCMDLMNWHIGLTRTLLFAFGDQTGRYTPPLPQTAHFQFKILHVSY